jgi:hypothetical protein
MTMEYDDNQMVGRAHSRRWVSIIAVIIPVTAIVLLAAWFVRVYVAPATVLIPNPPMITAETPAAPAVSARAETAAPQPPVAMAEPVTTTPPAGDRPASTLPMIATLAAVPPSLGSAPPTSAFADPGQDAAPAPPSIMVEEPPALEPGEPIAGPVPLPRTKPHGPVAHLASSIPLPRPRPAEIAPPPDDLPAVDRHAID